MTRPPLTRASIVAAGRRLADAEGASALSMRRLAAELGRTPMALYRHVADKRELLVLVLDDIASDIDVTVPDAEPAEQLRTLFEGLHGYLSGYPWVVDVLRQGELYAPSALIFVETVLETLVRAGLDDQKAITTYYALWYFTIGHLVSAHPRDPQINEGRRAIAEQAPLDQLPHVSALLPVMTGDDVEHQFGRGLRLLIAGLL